MATIVPAPLANREQTGKSLFVRSLDKYNQSHGVKETRLLTVVAGEQGKPVPSANSYPRDEVLAEEE